MAWNAAVPSDDGLLINAPGQIRANWDALALGTDSSLLITNAKISSSAAIVDTKLAQITTAGKVSGAALTSLANIPAGAGTVPLANIPSTLTNKSADQLDGQDGLYYLALGNATGTLALANGGTGQITANAALNALLPTQTGNANKALVTDGSNTSWTTISTNYAAGAFLIGGPTRYQSTIGTSYEKVGEIYVPRAGTLTIKFGIIDINPTNSGQAQIYRNGVAVGTARNTINDGTWHEFSEDIAGWAVGDLCQLYAHSASGNDTGAGDLRLYENTPSKEIVQLNTTPIIHFGNVTTGSIPPGLGSQGDIFLRLDGAAGTTLYVKTGASTWTAK